MEMLVDKVHTRHTAKRFHIPCPGWQYITASGAASAIAVTLEMHHTTLMKYSRSESSIILLSISRRAYWAIISIHKWTTKTAYAGNPHFRQT